MFDYAIVLVFPSAHVLDLKIIACMFTLYNVVIQNSKPAYNGFQANAACNL